MNEDEMKGMGIMFAIAAAFIIGILFGGISSTELEYTRGVLSCKAQVDARCQPRQGEGQ